MILQIGMHVKIIDDKIGFPQDSGTIKEVTGYLPNFLYGERDYELDNRKGDIFLVQDFEYCIEYPHLKLEP